MKSTAAAIAADVVSAFIEHLLCQVFHVHNSVDHYNSMRVREVKAQVINSWARCKADSCS